MQRRDFIKSAAAAGVLASVAPGLISCSGTKSTPRGDGKLHMEFFPYELKLAHTFTVASYSRTVTPDVQVEISYEGVTGYGEASMPPYLGHTVESVCAFLQKVDIEQFSDPFQIEDILNYVDSLSDGDAPAKAAIDIALHDLVGKLMGQPLWKIYGFNPAKALSTSFTIGIDTADVVREKTKEALGRFNVLKVKVGLDNDKEMINTIREVTDVPLVVDANQGWTDKYKALDMIHWLAEQGVQMCEQPMPKEMLDDIAWLTERSPIPTFADESIQRLKDIPHIKGAFTGINIKLMKCTGMREALKMIHYAKAEGMKVMLGCMTETSAAVSAAAQFSPVVDFCDLDGNLLIANDRFEGVKVVDGKLTLSNLPGLGLTKL